MAKTITPGVIASTKLRFVPQRKLAAQVAANPQMGVMLKARAELAAENTRKIGPVGNSKAGDHYVEQIESFAVITSSRGGWLARVIANKFTSGFIEFGTSKMRAFAPLRKGAEMAGLVFISRRRKKKAA